MEKAELQLKKQKLLLRIFEAEENLKLGAVKEVKTEDFGG